MARSLSAKMTLIDVFSSIERKRARSLCSRRGSSSRCSACAVARRLKRPSLLILAAVLARRRGASVLVSAFIVDLAAVDLHGTFGVEHQEQHALELVDAAN